VNYLIKVSPTNANFDISPQRGFFIQSINNLSQFCNFGFEVYAQITKENKKSKTPAQGIRFFLLAMTIVPTLMCVLVPLGEENVDHLNTHFNKNNLLRKIQLIK
jgi:hypothetical protein